MTPAALVVDVIAMTDGTSWCGPMSGWTGCR